MKHLLASLFVLAMCAFGSAVRADSGPAVSGPPDASEARFVRAVQADLGARFPHPADAERAGFVRYTNVDDTGAISYAKLDWPSAAAYWKSTDPRHPSQLWYDAHGRLLGADFSVPKSPTPPHLWGVRPGRWATFDAHIHYVTIDRPSGKKTYDGYVMAAKFAAAGGDPTEPKPATLVKLGRAKSTADVATIFLFPDIWDLEVWVLPNPNGAFADKNPLVTPSR
jgi:hypothetical protein